MPDTTLRADYRAATSPAPMACRAKMARGSARAAVMLAMVIGCALHASADDAPVISAQTCSNAACHGNFTAEADTSRLRFDEYHIWTTDPHRSATQTLYGARSRRILQNLKLIDGNGDVAEGQQRRFETTWENCRQCHDTRVPGHSAGDEAAWLAEGVSCTACHGSADEWVPIHYRSRWKQMSAEEKTAGGYRNLDDLVVQARVCAACHVGQPEGEVNHDLIAAGHPAMRFDFTWYHHRLPPHWNSARREMPSQSASSSAAWLIGQMASAEASLNQLHRRAEAADRDAEEVTWPEFADAECFACHHDLDGAPLWRPLKGLESGVGAGSPTAKVQIPWQPWELQLSRPLAEQIPTDSSQVFLRELNSLQEHMQSGLTPDPRPIAPLAQSAADSLSAWLDDSKSMSGDSVDTALRSMILDQKNPEWCVERWDRAAQLFYGIAASYRDGQTTVPDDVKVLRNALRFPAQETEAFDSPKTFVGPTDPDAGDRAKAMQLLRSIAGQRP